MARLVIGTNKTATTPAVVRDMSPESYRVFELDSSGMLLNSQTTPFIPLPAGTKDISSYLFYRCYSGTPASVLSGTIDMSSLEGLTGQNACSSMFYNCTGITSINLSSLFSVSANYACSNMFDSCTGITNINLDSLTSVTAQYGCSSMFFNCTGITTADLSSLVTISANNSCEHMFAGCTSLASANLSHLCKLGTRSNMQYMFRNTALTSLSFPNLAYTNTNINSAFSNTLSGVTGCTVHFPSDWQTKMSTWTNITNGLGGTNTTVLFDLPAVTTLDLSHITSIYANSSFSSFNSSNYFPNVTSVNLSNLTKIKGSNCCNSMFENNTVITSVDLSSLKTISGYYACNNMFANCTGITSINLGSLETIEGTDGGTECSNMFGGSGLTSITFTSLKRINSSGALQNMFQSCSSLISVSFPALISTFGIWTNVFQSMLRGCTGVTVHFPSNLQSVIGSWSDVTNGFGGTNTTVLFDLPATE